MITTMNSLIEFIVALGFLSLAYAGNVVSNLVNFGILGCK